MEKDIQQRSNEFAKSFLKEMRPLFKKLDSKNDKVSEQAREEIESNSYGTEVHKYYSITLGGGGPAIRVYGELDEHNQPETAEIQYQDWFQPWTTAETETTDDDDLILKFAQQFYFGE